MTHKDKLWLLARAAVLPLLAIAPFFLIKDSGASCLQYSKQIVGQFTHQSFGTGTVYEMRISGEPHYFGVILWLILVAFIISTVLQVGPKRYRLRRDFAKQQLLVSLGSIIVTLPTYVLLYLNSQLKYPPTWWCDSHSQLHGGIPTAAHFGLGLAPIAMAFFTWLYLLSTLLPFLALRSKKRFGGQKKQNLFQ